MAPTNPETWTHGPSIFKENELREVAVLLGKGFRVHHPDAVGGISLSYNPNPQKYMVMQYHSVENGFRLPLHGLLRDLCLHFGFAPRQLTANAHKYVASYILRCCALDRTPKLDEFLLLFSIGGFPFYSLYPHNHFPIFEKVEFKYEKWSLRYFVIEFPAHSPLDLPGVVLRRSISRTKFAAAELAEGVFNALREKEGVPSPERSKSPSAAESNPAMSSTGNQPQGDSTALVICKPVAALEAVPISAIPGLRRPSHPRNNLGKELLTMISFPISIGVMALLFHPAPCQLLLKLEEEVEGQEEPESSPTAEKEIGIQKVPDAPSTAEKEAEEQKDAEVLPEMRRETGGPKVVKYKV
ncbi:unnamed protein product [Cuscuta campestris]|uniref:Uncharacterized protein n=1 Tax=Cuscuta campestris TaxID=132261 RepID=A0A484MAK8_9ASTE|nr:unnamed protein product [Cuscuta campestris]